MQTDDHLVAWLLFVVIAAWLLLNAIEALKERSRQVRLIKEERDDLIGSLTPSRIQYVIDSFYWKIFGGDGPSPLDYIGYHVGKTKGLREGDRQNCLRYCFVMEIPKTLQSKYQNWGRPATYLRYAKILGHLKMLADQRRFRTSYEIAVADWDSDCRWLVLQFDEIALRLSKYGFRR